MEAANGADEEEIPLPKSSAQDVRPKSIDKEVPETMQLPPPTISWQASAQGGKKDWSPDKPPLVPPEDKWMMQTPPKTGHTMRSKRNSMFSGLKPALSMVEHIQENLNTYARKTQVDEIEKTVQIIGKKVYEEDQ